MDSTPAARLRLCQSANPILSVSCFETFESFMLPSRWSQNSFHIPHLSFLSLVFPVGISNSAIPFSMRMPPSLITWSDPTGVGQGPSQVSPSQGASSDTHPILWLLQLPRLPVVLTLITQCWNGLLIYFPPTLCFIIGSVFPQITYLELKKENVSSKGWINVHFLSGLNSSRPHGPHAPSMSYVLLFLLLFFPLSSCP